MAQALADRFHNIVICTSAGGSPGHPIFRRFYAAPGSGNQAQIVWELKGLGKLSADMQFAPNGQILLPLANQLASVDTQGELQWECQDRRRQRGLPGLF